MPLKITRAVSNIAISKTYIDHENPDSRVVTASEKYIVSTISRSYNGVLCLPAPSTASGKAVWFSRLAVGRQKLAGVVQGICQKEGFDGIRTNQFLRETAAARIFDETLTNNIDHG